jgi:hypothetical protein
MDLMRARHRLSKLLLRHGIRFDDGHAWTQRPATGFQSVTLDWPAAHAMLLDARGAIDALCHRREQLEREIVALLPACPWAVQVGRLRCLRGVDTLTAVGLCSEIGDFERFARAGQLSSYVGLVPSESTTGQQRRLGSITKTGSGHARRLLVKASWHYRARPSIARALIDRQQEPAARGDRGRVVSAATAAPHLDTPGGPREAPHDHRGRGRPRARRILLGDHPNRVNSPTDNLIPSAGSVAARQRAGNPRSNYEQPPPQRLATPDPGERLPHNEPWSCGEHQPAYISLTARRAQPAGPPPTQPTTTPNYQRKCEKSTIPT